jgi:hypothetical protein
LILCSNALQINRKEKEAADKAPRMVHIGATAETEIRKQQHERRNGRALVKETQETFYDANDRRFRRKRDP